SGGPSLLSYQRAGEATTPEPALTGNRAEGTTGTKAVPRNTTGSLSVESSDMSNWSTQGVDPQRLKRRDCPQRSGVPRRTQCQYPHESYTHPTNHPNNAPLFGPRVSADNKRSTRVVERDNMHLSAQARRGGRARAHGSKESPLPPNPKRRARDSPRGVLNPARNDFKPSALGAKTSGNERVRE